MYVCIYYVSASICTGVGMYMSLQADRVTYDSSLVPRLFSGGAWYTLYAHARN